MELLKEVLSDVAIYLMLAIFTYASAYAARIVKRIFANLKLEAQKIEDERQRNLVNEALNKLEVLAGNTVIKIEQTVAGDLRTEIKAGNKDKTELINLSLKALKEITDSLKPEYQEAIADTFGDFQTYAKSIIEKKVFSLKNM